ncbi:isocitrate lyase/phosphoenolpyruvate mutase family protein [Pseudonocardia sp. CA-142604]|uniref:isocitrate lyase/phosphoenolpyruvate mutase family protein n=1 Tax=Pseudonocardia sp. CA-142604 TaxID=3240024 RepID=UPI003D8A30B8
MTEANLNLSVQQERADRFRARHAQVPLVLTNVWDAGSAHMIAAAGAAAIATSSGASSWSAGVPDGNQLCVEDVLAAVRNIAAAVDLPVSAAVEGGYTTTPEGCG